MVNIIETPVTGRLLSDLSISWTAVAITGLKPLGNLCFKGKDEFEVTNHYLYPHLTSNGLRAHSISRRGHLVEAGGKFIN